MQSDCRVGRRPSPSGIRSHRTRPPWRKPRFRSATGPSSTGANQAETSRGSSPRHPFARPVGGVGRPRPECRRCQQSGDPYRIRPDPPPPARSTGSPDRWNRKREPSLRRSVRWTRIRRSTTGPADILRTGWRQQTPGRRDAPARRPRSRQFRSPRTSARQLGQGCGGRPRPGPHCTPRGSATASEWLAMPNASERRVTLASRRNVMAGCGQHISAT